MAIAVIDEKNTSGEHTRYSASEQFGASDITYFRLCAAADRLTMASVPAAFDKATGFRIE